MVRGANVEPQYAQIGPCWASSHSRVPTYAFRVVGCDVSSLCLWVAGPRGEPPFRPRRRGALPAAFFAGGWGWGGA